MLFLKLILTPTTVMNLLVLILIVFAVDFLGFSICKIRSLANRNCVTFFSFYSLIALAGTSNAMLNSSGKEVPWQSNGALIAEG